MKGFMILTAVLVCLTSAGGRADEAKEKAVSAPAVESSKEFRDKMAKAHEKMAQCLRSDKSIDDCHGELHEQCQSVHGKEGCPMMGKMGKKGMHHRKAHRQDKE